MREPVESELFSLLYVSKLASPDAREVDGICRQSQRINEREGITGLLVFDGEAFCQLVEGSRLAISALLHRLERDRRHVDMRVLHFGRAPTRRFPSWRLGYAFMADPGAIERLQGTRSELALEAFDDSLGRLEPGVAASGAD